MSAPAPVLPPAASCWECGEAAAWAELRLPLPADLQEAAETACWLWCENHAPPRADGFVRIALGASGLPVDRGAWAMLAERRPDGLRALGLMALMLARGHAMWVAAMAEHDLSERDVAEPEPEPGGPEAQP